MPLQIQWLRIVLYPPVFPTVRDSRDSEWLYFHHNLPTTKERKGNKTENVIQLLDWFNGVLIGVYLLLPRCLFLFHSFLAKGHTLDLVCWSMRTNYLLIWDFCPNPNVILRLPLALMDNESPVDQKICTHSVGGTSGRKLREFTSKILGFIWRNNSVGAWLFSRLWRNSVFRWISRFI